MTAGALMIRLRTLGDSTIEVGTSRIGPDSTVLFALLLYLAVERGRPIPRARLRELLWPGVPEKKAWHSLRQLLYRLRQMGVPIDADGGQIMLDASAVDAFSPPGPDRGAAGWDTASVGTSAAAAAAGNGDAGAWDAPASGWSLRTRWPNRSLRRE